MLLVSGSGQTVPSRGLRFFPWGMVVLIVGLSAIGIGNLLEIRRLTAGSSGPVDGYIVAFAVLIAVWVLVTLALTVRRVNVTIDEVVVVGFFRTAKLRWNGIDPVRSWGGSKEAFVLRGLVEGRARTKSRFIITKEQARVIGEWAQRVGAARVPAP